MESFEQIYASVAAALQNTMVETTFNLFIRGIEPVSFTEGIVTLSVSTDFQKGIVEERYLVPLAEEFEKLLGFSVDIRIISRDTGINIVDSPPEQPQQPVSGDYTYTFDNFIVGATNKFAHAAAQAVAANPSGAYNPLFIYGASGLGKTHLLMAIKNEIEQTRPRYKTVYVEGENFTNELIRAISMGDTSHFHDKYRSADVLLADDIQFIGGKESTQEEFFHTFNELYRSAKQIVLASDRPPKEIKSLEERMRTRFEWGLIADIQAPDLETRISILLRKASMLNFEMPLDVAEFIANQVKEDIRQLEGIVNRINAHRIIDDVPPTILSAQSAIKDIQQEHRPIPVTVEKVLEEVSRTFGNSVEDIKSSRRDSDISFTRQVAMYVLREVTPLTMEDIGFEFSGRNHSTVTHALKRISSLILSDTRLRGTIEDIIKNVKG
ncbi:MAG: chromosomal replication initiator protein DnaA [Oscillospiraceae bacterium]|nr:chromosomal replication initiator protein DnaA [Oscillospiraceae bacterium]